MGTPYISSPFAMIENFFLAERMTMIAWRLSYPLRIVIVLVLLASTDVMGQNCDCPLATACSPCSGGFVEITLRYKGSVSGYVTIFDGLDQRHFGYHAQNETFSFTGSLQNGKFQSSAVAVHFNFSLFADAMFGTSCGDEFPGSASGMFEVVSIRSIGGPVCCQPGSLDDDAPNISNMPSNQEVDLGPTECSRTVDWLPPTVTDACLPITTTPTHYPNLTLFSRGTTEVTYTAEDKYGNSSTKKFKITVKDVTAPTINCPANITLPANAECKATFTLPTVTATDACGTIQATPNSNPSSFNLGQTTIIYTAKDASGNKSTCPFTVTVVDQTKPVFEKLPSDISVTLDNSCTKNVPLEDLKATDNCSSASVTASHDKDYEFPIGTTRVKYTAIDAAGNSDTCSLKVLVKNPTDPKIEEECPGNLTVNSEPNTDSTTVTWKEPMATVECGEVTVAKSHEPGSRFPIGISPVKYTFTDESGRSSICEFDVHVLKPDELFVISKVVTPDGDGINDVWELSNIENFKSNTVVVIDRWGNKIFQATGYDNERTVWKGTNESGTIVPTGTYFYTIEVRDQGKVVLKKGFIEVIQ
jgi:gliding motility-associated-like protein